MPRRKAEVAGRTDWAALRSLSEDEIEAIATADADNPATQEDHWAGATLVASPRAVASDQTATRGIASGKTAIHARFDRDIVEFFKRGGRDYQARMNAVLRRYVDAQGGGTEP